MTEGVSFGLWVLEAWEARYVREQGVFAWEYTFNYRHFLTAIESQ